MTNSTIERLKERELVLRHLKLQNKLLDKINRDLTKMETDVNKLGDNLEDLI